MKSLEFCYFFVLFFFLSGDLTIEEDLFSAIKMFFSRGWVVEKKKKDTDLEDGSPSFSFVTLSESPFPHV